MGKSYTLVEEVETKPWEHGNVCKISKENNMCYSDIVFPCPVKNYRSSKYIYLFHIFMNVYHIFISLFQHFTIHHYTILPLHHYTILLLHHFITFEYYLIRNYLGKMSKLIQNYQGT